MSDKSSLHLRLVSSLGTRAMSEAIALEIMTICRRAAEPIHAGETVKAQIRRAWENLGRPAMWRVKSGWYSDSAGSWSAAAVRDFQDRYRSMVERRSRRDDHDAIMTRLLTDTHPPTTLEAARDELRTIRARIDALETTLRLRT